MSVTDISQTSIAEQLQFLQQLQVQVRKVSFNLMTLQKAIQQMQLQVVEFTIH